MVLGVMLLASACSSEEDAESGAWLLMPMCAAVSQDHVTFLDLESIGCDGVTGDLVPSEWISRHSIAGHSAIPTAL